MGSFLKFISKVFLQFSSLFIGIDVTDLPEGVDPSFLAALPEEMRQEVIDEQRRLQTIRQVNFPPVFEFQIIFFSFERFDEIMGSIFFVCFTNFRFRFQRAAQNVEAGVSEVDPQFLAALPTNIQEEVLAQQRIEQQRQAAQANPEAPVDPGEFLQTLPGKISRLLF